MKGRPVQPQRPFPSPALLVRRWDGAGGVGGRPCPRRDAVQAAVRSGSPQQVTLALPFV